MPGYAGGELLHGRYRLQEMIGSGSLGTTWKAYDTGLGISVCVKQFFDASSKLTVSIYGEARLLWGFRDEPGIVRMLDVFVEDGTAYLVMEFLEGDDLSVFVRERGTFSMDDTLSLLDPVFDALKSIHQAGIIHRDVSPENIRVIRDENAPLGYTTKLMDFGATAFLKDRDDARPDDSAHAVVLLQTDDGGEGAGNADAKLDPHHAAMNSVVVVRPGYSSPEQYHSPRGLTPAADVYSLAATIWYCLTGSSPETVKHRKRSALRRCRNLGKTWLYRCQVSDVLLRALDSDANRHPQSVGLLRDELNDPPPSRLGWMAIVLAVALIEIVSMGLLQVFCRI